MYYSASMPPARGPIRYTIDRARRVLLIDLLEIDDVPALILALERTQVDPAFSPGYDICVDCGYMGRVPTADEVRAVAHTGVGQSKPNLTGRCAIVAAWSSVYGAARLFALLAGAPNNRLRVFRSHADAFSWLSTPTERTDRVQAIEDPSWATGANVLNEMVKSSGLGRG